jgi:hypothetical protein
LKGGSGEIELVAEPVDVEKWARQFIEQEYRG